jgi:hypothetical protein
VHDGDSILATLGEASPEFTEICVLSGEAARHHFSGITAKDAHQTAWARQMELVMVNGGTRSRSKESEQQVRPGPVELHARRLRVIIDQDPVAQQCLIL